MAEKGLYSKDSVTDIKVPKTKKKKKKLKSKLVFA